MPPPSCTCHLLLLLALALPCLPVHAKKNNKGSKDKKAALEKRLAEEKEIKAQFGYSFNDIANSIVIVSCSGEAGRSSGSGFIAMMHGKPYLLTNQHVILGAEKISFKTAAGITLKPHGVQLSTTRDIARLPLAEGNGLTISKNMTMDSIIGVFGNSEGGGVATELYGKVTGIEADLVEVSADFVSGNSGSPVLNLNQEVIGIASYVKYNTDDEDGSKTRRFCYRLTGNQWKSVKWKAYNDKYGKLYREKAVLIDSIFEVANEWYDDPFTRMTADNHTDIGLRKWSGAHNSMIKRIDRTAGTAVSQHKLDNTNKQIRKDMSDSATALSKVCRDSARNMRFLSEKQRELTDFLRDEFERLANRLEYAADQIDEYGLKLSTHNYFYFKTES